MDKELHLFIIWNNAYSHKDEILKDIKSSFTIRNIFEIKWSEKYFNSNLTRFYGTSLPKGCAKEEHIGRDKFLLVIVEVSNPKYETRKTSHGESKVCIDMFEKKQKYRELTAGIGSHMIHATDTTAEFNHDLTLLLGLNKEDYTKKYKMSKKVISLDQDLPGAETWKTAEEMFYVLNNCTNYAILRNWESLPNEIYVNEHNDIDLICSSRDDVAYVLNARKAQDLEYRVQYHVDVDGKTANFDLRYVGDNYYCKGLETNILNNRVYSNKGFYVLNDENYFYTLLYHTFIQKPKFSEDYKQRLLEMNDNFTIKIVNNPSEIAKFLEIWLNENKYTICEPYDKTVYFNYDVLQYFNSTIFDDKDSNYKFTEDIVMDLIKKYPKDYEEAFKEDSSWSVVYNLSSMRKNVISWYPFKNDCSILEIGAEMGAITNELCKHAKKVTCIESSLKKSEIIKLRNKSNKNLEVIVNQYNNIDLKEKYDYILLIGSYSNSAMYMDTNNPFVDFLNDLKKYLKKDGKILIAIENKYGLKYWCGANEDHTNVPFDGINNYYSGLSVRTFSKKEIEDISKEVNMFPNFYYMFPDYKFPQVIYTDESLNDKFFSNYNNILNEKMDYIIKEKELYLDLYKNQKLSFFSNSFLIELTFENEKKDIIFAKYNNDYRNKYTDLITYVKNNKVYKKACYKEGEKQIDNILEIEKILKNNDIPHSIVEKEKDVIYSKIEKGDNLENRLVDLYKLNQWDKISDIFNSIFLLIEKCSGKIASNNQSTIFDVYGIKINDKKKEKMTFYEKCLIDIIPNNIIINEDKICLIDQEWYLKNCPIEYAMFRAINCFISDVKDIELRDILYKKYNIDIKSCQSIEEEFFSTITKESFNIYSFYKSNFEMISLNDLKEELNNTKMAIENYKTNSKNQKEYIDKLNDIIKDQKEYVDKLNSIIKNNENNSNSQKEYIDNLNKIIEESKDNSKQADNYIKSLEGRNRDLERENRDMSYKIENLNDDLNSIYNSRIWKIISGLGLIKKNETNKEHLMMKKMSNNAIEVRNMTKYFKLNSDKPNTLKERFVRGRKNKVNIKEVLTDINLTIKKGETVALIGVNGSGKSTLLKLMTKIIYPNKGSVITNGKLTSLLELGAGFHLDFTGRENIYFNASIFGLTRKEIDERINDIIEFSELGDNIDLPIRTYSSGMYMRLAFSVAINVDAEILLIDEILAVGDQHFQDKCFDKLMELSKSDKTIVIVSHTLATLKKLCNRAIWINNGKIVMDGNCSRVIDEYKKECA